MHRADAVRIRIRASNCKQRTLCLSERSQARIDIETCVLSASISKSCCRSVGEPVRQSPHALGEPCTVDRYVGLLETSQQLSGIRRCREAQLVQPTASERRARARERGLSDRRASHQQHHPALPQRAHAGAQRTCLARQRQQCPCSGLRGSRWRREAFRGRAAWKRHRPCAHRVWTHGDAGTLRQRTTRAARVKGRVQQHARGMSVARVPEAFEVDQRRCVQQAQSKRSLEFCATRLDVDTRGVTCFVGALGVSARRSLPRSAPCGEFPPPQQVAQIELPRRALQAKSPLHHGGAQQF
mmetsp:Transcript_6455/g.26211  ORF Transcript_6455/g.26211 Transcript_6455/m.26211 type:complete len:298 (+) Transcript_6455:11651-12544(+)